MSNYRRTFLDHINRLPPFVVFAIARRRMRDRRGRERYLDLVKRSGLSEPTFRRIAHSLSWDDVKTGNIQKFCEACNVNLLCQWQHLRFLQLTMKRPHRPLSHLDANQLRKFNELCRRWLNSQGVTSPSPSR